ncbi:hypothetical protein IV102_06435 [bacterium]|nr:hypothetical protein [bacterium]
MHRMTTWLLGLSLLASPGWAKRPPPPAFQLGFQQFHQHHWVEALRLADQALTEDPKCFDAFWLKAFCQLQLGQHSQVRQTAINCRKVAGDEGERNYADYLLAEGWTTQNPAKAQALLDESVHRSTRPWRAEAQANAAWYYVKHAQGAKALELIDLAIPRMSLDRVSGAYDTRGAALVMLGRYKEAWIELEKAAKLYNSPNLMFHRAQCLEGLNRPREALKLYTQSLQQGGWHEFEALARKRIRALEKS